MLTLVVLKESVAAPDGDEFEGKVVEQLCVLRLRADGVYETETWRKNDDNERALLTRVEPRRRGKPLAAIPFVFHGPESCRPWVQKGPLTDLIPLNLDHYRLDADYKHGIHFTALPTAWVAGFDPSAVLRIGSKTA